jgi:hypothetical protein
MNKFNIFLKFNKNLRLGRDLNPGRKLRRLPGCPLPYRGNLSKWFLPQVPVQASLEFNITGDSWYYQLEAIFHMISVEHGKNTLEIMKDGEDCWDYVQ